jgi:hypothetical protein
VCSPYRTDPFPQYLIILTFTLWLDPIARELSSQARFLVVGRDLECGHHVAWVKVERRSRMHFSSSIRVLLRHRLPDTEITDLQAAPTSRGTLPYAPRFSATLVTMLD